MLLTNTGSLMYKIETENVYDGLHKGKELFDFRNYSKDSKYYNGANNLVIGKMKDDFYFFPRHEKLVFFVQ